LPADRTKVLIVHNQPVLPRDHPDSAQELDVLDTVADAEKVLTAGGFDVARFGYARDPRLLLDRLRHDPPDVVFNLFEGEADRTATEIYHAAVLEWADVPFTGASSSALALGRDKVRAKYLLQGAGIQTAPFVVVEEARSPQWPHAWPAFVKPACQDASVGIDQGSVVTNQGELAARVALLFERYSGPVLVEKYIPGREFHVHVFEWPEEGGATCARVAPPAEVRFQAGPGFWPIYTYEGKWNESSIEFKSTPLVSGVELEDPLRERVEQVPGAAYKLLGMRDYARVDLRVTPEGEVFVLEVNPNPDLNSLLLINALKSFGISFPQFVCGLVRNALERK
jgi:D-alanine-D-alanine ligase